MRKIKIAIAMTFIAIIVAALATETLGYPPFMAKAKKYGAKDCTFCHVDPAGGTPWNERGEWLMKEKEKRNADVIDVDWLATYKPAKKGKKKSAEPQAIAQPATQK